MKKLLVFSIAAGIALCSCNNSKKSQTKVESNDSVVAEKGINDKEQGKSVTELYRGMDKNINKVVSCKGKVQHVCSHSGKRCFLIDKEGNSIKIESGGEIKGFSKNVLGKNMLVKGILKQVKIDKEAIEKMAKEQDHCDTESSNIKKMREWMKKNNKDYYSVYFIQCIDYEVLE